MKAMMTYILEQPAMFGKMLADRAGIAAPFAEALQKAQPDRLILVASGTSRNAAAAAAPLWSGHWTCRWMSQRLRGLAALWAKRPFLIFVSQGGNSTNTIAAIERTAQYPSLALTGDPEGHINTLCPHAVLIACGEEKAGPKTKGYTGTILTLYLMALEAGRESGSLTAEAYADCVKTLENSGRTAAVQH